LILSGILGGTAEPVYSDVYVHEKFITFEWAPAAGSVDYYSILTSENDEPYRKMLEVQAPANNQAVRGVLLLRDLSSYRVMVQAVSDTFGIGPFSNPSERIRVFLNGTETDTDGDEIPNEWEESFGLDPFDPTDGGSDADADLLSNLEEYLHGTDPLDPDSDHDGIVDGDEVQSGMNPLNPLDNVPRANAGPNLSRTTGQLVVLDGSKSWDPNGDPLTYRWEQTAGPLVPMHGAVISACEFVAFEPGQYSFGLVVSDGKAESQMDRVQVWISRDSAGPVARAGRDFLAQRAGPVILDGTESGGQGGDSLSYSWEQVDGPLVTLSDPEDPRPAFQPVDPGFYTFELVVHNGTQASSPDYVVVNVVDELVPGDIFPRENLDGSLNFLDLTLWWFFFLQILEPTGEEFFAIDVAPMSILSEEGNELLIRLEPDGQLGPEDGELLSDISKGIFRVIGWEFALE